MCLLTFIAVFIILKMSKKLFYHSPLLSLSLIQKRYTTLLTLEMFDTRINTRHLPLTVNYLERHFPTVLDTQCFNEEGLSFREEVKETEIGHLFEHIIIDELCLLKLDSGFDFATYNGNTSWNWEREKEGLFHIIIDIGSSDNNLLEKALDKAIFFLELLFRESENPTLNPPLIPAQFPQLLLHSPQKLQ